MSDAIAPTEWNLDTYRDLLTRVLALKIPGAQGNSGRSRQFAGLHGVFLRYLQWEINGLHRPTADKR